MVASSRPKRGTRTARAISARELARSVRKPTAPPARVEKPLSAYDRRRRRRAIDDSMEES